MQSNKNLQNILIKLNYTAHLFPLCKNLLLVAVMKSDTELAVSHLDMHAKAITDHPWVPNPGPGVPAVHHLPELKWECWESRKD